MAKINNGRLTVDFGDAEEVVVFLIGMRINKLHRPDQWLPVFTAMPKMIAELMKAPDSGLLAQPRTFLSGRTGVLVQYWKSFEALNDYARDADKEHLPAWRAFNRRTRDNGAVGIYHETYRVPVDRIEAIYGNMPTFGLGKAFATRKPGSGTQSAAARMGVGDDVPAVEPY
jgi:hypothetical protein